MRKITLYADAALVDKARAVAHARGSTLNAAFRDWLLEFATGNGNAKQFDSLIADLQSVSSGKHFSREELNRR